MKPTDQKVIPLGAIASFPSVSACVRSACWRHRFLGAFLVLLSSLLGAPIASGAGSLWAFGYSVNEGPRPLYKINPANGSIAQTLTTSFRPEGFGTDVANLGLAYGAGNLWALGYSVNEGPRPLYRINMANGGLAQTLTTPFRPPGYGNDVAGLLSLAAGGGYLWALGYSVNNSQRPLYKISPANGGIAQTLTTPFRPEGFGNDVAALGMAYGGGYLWAFGYSVNEGPRPLYKINPTNGALVQTLTTPFRPQGFGNDIGTFGLAYGGSYLWALGYSVNNGPRPLYKISPASGGIVQTLTTPFRPEGFGNDVGSLGLTYNDVAQVNVLANPLSGGTVSGGGSMDIGTSVPVTAAAASGWRFLNWTQGGAVLTTSLTYTLTVAGDCTLTANFTNITYTLTTSNSPPGAGTASGGGTYIAGSTARILAAPNLGYLFSGWNGTGTGAYTGTNNPATLTMKGSVTEVASYVPVPPTAKWGSMGGVPGANGAVYAAAVATNGVLYIPRQQNLWLESGSGSFPKL